MNLSTQIDALNNNCHLTEEEALRRSKFNCRNYPWITIMKFKNSDEVETWRKFGTPFYLRITHGGASARSKCSLICEPTNISEEHIVERKKVVCASYKCNDKENKCPIQYRLLNCMLTDSWWVQGLEEWWRGPKGTDEPAVHLNKYPDAKDEEPIMHTAYKKKLEDMHKEDPRRPKQLVNIIASQQTFQV